MIHRLEGNQDINSFLKINQILEFTAKAEIPLSEDHVREHLSFFKALLDQINQDLTKIILEQAEGTAKTENFNNLLNCLTFSFAMNFDEESLWLKLYQAIKYSITEQD